MLAFEVEFLTGVSVAASPSSRERSEWPPHPDRLFQALVAAWGRDEARDPRERQALEWLESLPVDDMIVVAPPARRRSIVNVYVPPNDAKTTGRPGGAPPAHLGGALAVVPEFRKNRQPRQFPAKVPAAERPIVRYLWPSATAADLEHHKEPLARLAREVTYLGHSHSLVRVALVEDALDIGEAVEGWLAVPGRPAALRMPHPGRLASLEDSYNRGVRPNPSLVLKTFRPSGAAPPGTVFDPETITVLADEGGLVPSLVAFPLVAKRLRDAWLAVAEANSLPVPPLLSGHDPGGIPTRKPHVAIVPLADVGWTHSSGRLMGIALVWPRGVEADDRRAALRILAAFFSADAAEVGLLGARRDSSGILHFGAEGTWRLALEPEPDRASLRPWRYTEPARRWATVLPMALDRHPKDRPGESLENRVADACRSVGLPPEAVDGLAVKASTHGAVKAAPSVGDVRKALPADSRYRGRYLCHVVVTFRQPVRGPLILGAGRFRGLGLCLPKDEEREANP